MQPDSHNPTSPRLPFPAPQQGRASVESPSPQTDVGTSIRRALRERIEEFADAFENEGRIGEAAFLYELKEFLESIQ